MRFVRELVMLDRILPVAGVSDLEIELYNLMLMQLPGLLELIR